MWSRSSCGSDKKADLGSDNESISGGVDCEVGGGKGRGSA